MSPLPSCPAGIFRRTIGAMQPYDSPRFATTHWSVILAARDRAGDPANPAMEELCSTYWRPLYAYARRSGRSVEDAQDLTQSFFSRLLEKDYLRNVDPSLGKFRAFLLTALRNFLTNEWRAGNTWKRGGHASFFSTEEMTRAEDFYAASAGPETPEQIYERNWAIATLERAARRLEEEYGDSGKSAVYAHLKPYLEGDGETRRYADVAAALGISEVAVRVSVHRMRSRFRELLWREVGRTLPDPEDRRSIEEELRHMLAAL